MYKNANIIEKTAIMIVLRIDEELDLVPTRVEPSCQGHHLTLGSARP
jgi:hypothetical protein